MMDTSYSKAKILIVIDPTRELALIRNIVQKYGYQLWETDTAEPALGLARQHLPELALLDITASSVDQASLAPLINYLQQQQVPLILITSESPHAEVNRYLNFVTLDYIQRPIDPVILMLRIKSALRCKKIQLALKLVRQKLEESHHKLQQTSIFDELTGVFNHAHLLSLVKLEFARGVRYNSPLAILLADIPGLNEVKEDYGLKVSDHLLREVAQLIKNALRFTDIIGRCKENRFGVLLSETGQVGAKKIVSKLHSTISDHCFDFSALAGSPEAKHLTTSGKLPLKLDIKLGFSAYPDERVANYEELLEAANRALLQTS